VVVSAAVIRSIIPQVLLQGNKVAPFLALEAAEGAFLRVNVEVAFCIPAKDASL